MPFNTIRKLLWRTSIAVALSTVILILASPQRALAGVRGLLVGDQYFSNLSPSLVATTKTSGYNTLILFLVNVNTNGDLVGPNNEPLVSNGVYNGNSSWGAQLASLKAAPSCINRIEMFTGGASGRSFPDIQSLVNSQGTGSGSILYRNFQALYNATHVDAICFDDESTYDLSTSVPFGRMLAALGMRVTLCPYTNQSYWASLLSQLGPYNAGSGSVDGVYLQCYDGGAGNDPGNWKSALGGYDKVYPGLWTNSESVNVNSISTVTSKMRNWQSSDGIIGGWIDANGTSPAVNDPWAQDVAYGIDQPYFNIINKYSNNSMDLIGANGAAGADINLWAGDSSSINQRWALVPTENGNHFKLISWDTGYCACIAGDSTGYGAQLVDSPYTGNDAGQQFDLVDAGNGWFYIRNVNSGLVLDDYQYGTGNNNEIDQWSNNSTNGSGADLDNQLWRLSPSVNYNYFIRANTGGGEYICCEGGQGPGGQDGASIITYLWENSAWFKWDFTTEGDGWYGLFSENSPTRVLCVDNGSYADAADCHLWDYNPSNYGDQKIRIEPKTDGNYKFYWDHDGMSWDLPGGEVGNFVPLQQYPDNGSYWQEFNLERTP